MAEVTVRSVDRALRILQAFSSDEQEMSLSDLGRRFELQERDIRIRRSGNDAGCDLLTTDEYNGNLVRGGGDVVGSC